MKKLIIVLALLLCSLKSAAPETDIIAIKVGEYRSIIKIIKYFEGLRLQPYDDGKGFLTVCYGCRQIYNNSAITSWTKKQCDSLLEVRFNRCYDLATKYTSGYNYKQHLIVAELIFAFGLGNLIELKILQNNRINTKRLAKMYWFNGEPNKRKMLRRNYECQILNK